MDKIKTWTIDNKEIAKCNDFFEYDNPKIKGIKDYVDILKEFYGKKGSKNKSKKPAHNRTVTASPLAACLQPGC